MLDRIDKQAALRGSSQAPQSGMELGVADRGTVKRGGSGGVVMCFIAYSDARIRQNARKSSYCATRPAGRLVQCGCLRQASAW
ncbi:MAG: hypothetical protein ACLT98_18350 [Eggerthellaceae bacterium]